MEESLVPVHSEWCDKTITLYWKMMHIYVFYVLLRVESFRQQLVMTYLMSVNWCGIHQLMIHIVHKKSSVDSSLNSPKIFMMELKLKKWNFI